jgi:hypothetical protein
MSAPPATASKASVGFIGLTSSFSRLPLHVLVSGDADFLDLKAFAPKMGFVFVEGSCLGAWLLRFCLFLLKNCYTPLFSAARVLGCFFDSGLVLGFGCVGKRRRKAWLGVIRRKMATGLAVFPKQLQAPNKS